MRTTTAAFVFASLTALSAGACSHQQQAAAPGSKAAAQAVPAGTEFTARLNDAIGTKISSPGEFFTASVVAPVRAPDGSTVIREGALIRGRVVGVDKGPAPSIRLSFQSLDTDRGPMPISVTVLKTTSPQATYRVEEVYTPNLPYNAILLPKAPTSVGGGPGEKGGAPGGAPGRAPSQAPAAQINLPVGTPLQLVLTQPLSMPAAKK
jgi:hypothetical protein